MVVPNTSLDPTDRKIVGLLQAEGRLSNVELAERVPLSPSPCLRRVRRLEEKGVVRGYRAVLDREAVGLGLTVFVEIKVRNHTRENAAALSALLSAMPEVVACHMISGVADFLVEIVVADLKAYERLLSDHLLTLPMQVEVRSNFSLRLVKADGALPLGKA